MEAWEQKLLERRAGFIDKALARLAEMQNLIASAELGQLKRHFHQLAGSAGIHEMDEFCQHAIAGEDLCTRLHANNASCSTADLSELGRILSRLQIILEEAIPNVVSATDGAICSTRTSVLQSGAAKILSVEDDPEYAAFIVEALQGAGYNVHTISDAARFSEELKAFRPDLLLLDIVVGEFDGIALAQQVRDNQSWSDIPIVFLSTQRDPAAQIADCTYLSKPISANLLISTISEKLRSAKQ